MRARHNSMGFVRTGDQPTLVFVYNCRCPGKKAGPTAILYEIYIAERDSLVQVWKTEIDDLEDEPPPGTRRSLYHWFSWCCQKDIMTNVYAWLQQAVWGS